MEISNFATYIRFNLNIYINKTKKVFLKKEYLICFLISETINSQRKKNRHIYRLEIPNSQDCHIYRLVILNRQDRHV